MTNKTPSKSYNGFDICVFGVLWIPELPSIYTRLHGISVLLLLITLLDHVKLWRVRFKTIYETSFWHKRIYKSMTWVKRRYSIKYTGHLFSSPKKRRPWITTRRRTGRPPTSCGVFFDSVLRNTIGRESLRYYLAETKKKKKMPDRVAHVFGILFWYTAREWSKDFCQPEDLWRGRRPMI